MANALNVRYEPNDNDRALAQAQAQQGPSQPAEEEAPPTADPQPAPAGEPDEYDIGLTDADFEAYCLEQQQKRHKIRDRRLQKRAPSASSSAALNASGWLAS